MHLHCTDEDGEWMVRLGSDTLTVTRDHIEVEVVSRGSASDILLLLWGRLLRVPAGKGATREVSRWWSPCRTRPPMPVFSPAPAPPLICVRRPKAIAFDIDASIVASPRGGMVRLVTEVAALSGTWPPTRWPVKPAYPEGKRQVELTIRYLEVGQADSRTP